MQVSKQPTEERNILSVTWRMPSSTFHCSVEEDTEEVSRPCERLRHSARTTLRSLASQSLDFFHPISSLGHGLSPHSAEQNLPFLKDHASPSGNHNFLTSPIRDPTILQSTNVPGESTPRKSPWEHKLSDTFLPPRSHSPLVEGHLQDKT